MKRFDYRKASSLEEALDLLSLHGERARILAGGTDLQGKIRNGSLDPDLLVDLKGVPGLDGIGYQPAEGLSLGALASIHRLAGSSLVRGRFGGIAQAASSLGSYQIRCRATLGGNLCNASPAADMAPVLISLDAKGKIVGPKRERWLPLEDFFVGPGRTLCRPGEVLAEIRVPQPPPFSVSCYAKHTLRKAMDLAVVGVAVALTLSGENDACAEVKIALGAVGPAPFRASKAESLLRGRKLGEEAISQAARAAAEEARPITDIRASGEYRREMIRVFSERALKEAWRALSPGSPS